MSMQYPTLSKEAHCEMDFRALTMNDDGLSRRDELRTEEVEA